MAPERLLTSFDAGEHASRAWAERSSRDRIDAAARGRTAHEVLAVTFGVDALLLNARLEKPEPFEPDEFWSAFVQGCRNYARRHWPATPTRLRARRDPDSFAGEIVRCGAGERGRILVSVPTVGLVEQDRLTDDHHRLIEDARTRAAAKRDLLSGPQYIDAREELRRRRNAASREERDRLNEKLARLYMDALDQAGMQP